MGARFPATAAAAGPFDLEHDRAYRAWRDWKLAQVPADIDALTVEVQDPRALSAAEHAALLLRIARTNTAIYRSPIVAEDRSLVRALGAQLGLRRLDANWLADEDGVSPIAVYRGLPPTALRAGPPEEVCTVWGGPAPRASDGRGGFIPYTDRALRWHTDGYYHPEARRIRGMILHCVRPAARGGVNALLDHELAYIALRDSNPAHVRALMQPDAMTIPARADDDGVARPAQSGPVFAVSADDGSLHMRYTARTRSIEWKDDAATRAAVAGLEGLLADANPWVWRVRLEAGMGIVGHNVLHDRTAFVDDPERPRLLYRARFLDRLAPARPPGS